MEYEIDEEKLKQDIIDYYGTAMFNGFPQAVIDLASMQNASLQELISEANKIGLDMNNYINGSFRR